MSICDFVMQLDKEGNIATKMEDEVQGVGLHGKQGGVYTACRWTIFSLSLAHFRLTFG